MPIAVENLGYVYLPGTPFESIALSDVSFCIEDGEYLGVIGHTGSGKTTLIKLVAALMKPTSGRVLLNGEDINQKGFDRKTLRKNVGVIFQYPEYQLFEETVYKDVAFGPAKMGLSPEEIEERVREALSLVNVDFEGVKERSPFELSGGQKRRVAIAGVLAMRPQVLIMDEPVAGLDPAGRENLFGLIRTLNEGGTTIVLITHSMDDLAANARRVIVMNKGSLVMDDTPKAVFSHAEELNEMGLGVPEISKIAAMLKSRGIDVPAGLISVGEMKRFVLSRIGGRP
jgi:energy-coupling factor transport system ATP-binding protein